MSTGDVVPELKQILGALIFSARRPLTVREMRKCLQDVAAEAGGETAAFGTIKAKDIKDALAELAADLKSRRGGFALTEVAGGFRFQTDASCGPWVRELLNSGKPSRLSRPSLETLAIIAYRQPVSRAEIEAVRGVSVDHVLKSLLEMQVVRIVGRSELPGRPLLYGTTQVFLEHFGLRNLGQLSEMEPSLAEELKRIRDAKPPPEEKGSAEDPQDPAPDEDGDVDEDEGEDGIEGDEA